MIVPRRKQKDILPKAEQNKPVPKEISDNEVMSYELIMEHEAVKQALDLLPDLKEPDTDLKDYLDKLGDIPEASDSLLENFLIVFAHWESYYEVKLKLANVIKSVADEQEKRFLKLAIAEDDSKANITEKRERAYSDPHHLEAVAVCQLANVKVDALETMVNACQRGYKAVSRVVSIRENLP